MNVKSRVKINTRKITQLSTRATRALELTAEALHQEIVNEGVVPRRDGTLEGEGMFVDYTDSSKGKVSIIHNTPYARRMYYHPEYHFHRENWEDERGKKHDGNPNAQGKWFKPWIDGNKKEFCSKVFEAFYKMGGPQ